MVAKVNTVIRLGSHIFAKVTRPGDSEVTFLVFESSCPVYQFNYSEVDTIR